MMRARLIGTLVIVTAVMATFFGLSRDSVARVNRDRNERQVVVRLEPGTTIAQLNGRHGTRTVEQIPGSDYYLLEIPDGASLDATLEQIVAEPGILQVGSNFNYRPPEIQQTSQAFIDQTSQAFIDQTSQAFIDAHVPVSYTGQSLVSNLHLIQAQNFARGAGVKVAVIDTGLDFAHPLFQGRIEYPVYDFVNDDGNPSEESPGAGYGHGTFVAGLIVLAAPHAMIMPLRAFAPDGSGTSFSIANAIRFAADNGADVINMSFGMQSEDLLVADAITYAKQSAYLVAAAGNENRDFVQYPAASTSNTISVTATNATDLKAPFSNFNQSMDVSAPGVDVYSAYPDGRWAWWSGTSFSTALVSGESALLLSLRPDATQAELDSWVLYSGVNINSLNKKYSGKLGRVRIDFLSAVNRLLAGSVPPSI